MQAAIDAVRPGRGPATIIISPGTYTGQVYVPPDKPDLTLIGATGRATDVVLTDSIAHGAPDTVIAQKYGYLITHSRIINSPGNLAAGSYSLGRPCIHTGTTDPVPQITIRDTVLPSAISPQQWQNWTSPPFRWQDARFYEYANRGPGSAAASDVPQLTAAQARQYTVAAYLAGWWPRELARWHP